MKVVPRPDDDPLSNERSASAWDRLADLPNMDEAPLDATWLRAAEPGVPPDEVPAPVNRPDHPGPTAHDQPDVPRDGRQFHVGPVEAEPWPAEWGPSDPGQPTDPTTEPRRGRRRRRRGWVGGLLVVLLLAVAAFAAVSWYLWSQVDKVDVAGALSGSPGGFTNYLIVGVDSRDGVDPNLDTAPQIGLGFEGSRSDTMMVLRIGADGNRMVSLPRDLWVSIDGSAGAKLNAATVIGGPAALIRTVQAELSVPLDRYMEVDLAGFLSVIDAVGSITIDFPAPACDPKSGLHVRDSGEVELGSEQALAYVRSRTYTEFDAASASGLDCKQIISNGLGTAVGVADFGRTERQREFLLAVFEEVSSQRNPITVLRVLSGLSDGLRVDDGMGIFDAVRLLRDLRGLDADTIQLPVSDFAAPDGSSALSLNAASADVLDLFR